jgi:phosphatidate cytidylyltransferase
VLALFTVFGTDTAAFFVGKAFGRHRMAPRISPGKTWEGAAAGLLAGVAVALLLDALFGLPLALWAAALVGAGVGMVAHGGDLVESALKRYVGAKDTGRLIPGHGGILDRLDSVVLSLVLVYYGARWVLP